MELKELIESTDCKVVFHEDWVGDPPNRHPVQDETKITRVRIELSADEWCSMCMRDGDNYIGGCCGSAGYIQDLLNGTFRDSGWLDAKELVELADACQNHPDGFESFGTKMSQKTFDENCKNWDEIHPFEKFATLWHGVRDRLSLGQFSGQPSPKDNLRDPKAAVIILQNGLQMIRYQDLFKSSQIDLPETGQKHGNSALLFARVIPAARIVEGALWKLQPGTFEGVGIYDKAAEDIASNGMGMCFYYTEEKAKEMIATWMNNGDVDKLKDRFEIKKVRISMENGIEYLG